MNLSSFPQKAYEIFTPLAGYKNKPNSNPIKPKTNPIHRKGEIDAKCVFTNDYEVNSANSYKKQSQNKPNSNPIS